MPIIDITCEVKNLLFNDKRVLNKSKLSNIKTGFYVFVFSNSFETRILDRNKQKNGQMGKVVVPEKSVVIKSGKFEKGLLERLCSYNKHMHYEGRYDSFAFTETLQSIKMFSLDDLVANQSSFRLPAVFEQFWNQSVFQKFHGFGALSKEQNYRSEYRLMNISSDECGNYLDMFLNDIANRIQKSSAVLFD